MPGVRGGIPPRTHPRHRSMKKKTKILTIVLSSVAFLAVVGTLIAFTVSGYVYYMGPFKQLAIEKIRWNYSTDRTGEIIFYGPSNFARWWNMEEDMAAHGFTVQNHAFGGSTDRELIDEAEYLVYPYAPRAVFLQTGSNDYAAGLTLSEVKANKTELYSSLSENLPDAVIIVMGGLPLPGRREYRKQTAEVNAFIADYCAAHENFYYGDSDSVILGEDGQPPAAYFESDGVHLTQKGHDAWTPLMVSLLEKAGIEPDL